MGIPVIMVTTAGREQDELLCRSSGCDDYLSKPINNKTFLEKGRKLIADFERRRQRSNYSGDVQFLEKGEPRHGLIADISKGGLFMAIPHDAVPDEPLDLAFTLPHDGSNILVAARGRVAWENRAHNLLKPAYPAGVGVEFTDIDPAIVMMIEKLLEGALET
jgi:Tfp pilus assembly protein PilZ